MLLVDRLDARGLLPASDDELADDLDLDAALVGEARSLLQQLEPRGLGAADSIEAMLLQAASDPDLPMIEALLRSHLEALGRNKLPEVARGLDGARDVALLRERRDRHRETLARSVPTLLHLAVDGTPVRSIEPALDGVAGVVARGVPLGGGAITGELWIPTDGRELDADEARGRIVVLRDPSPRWMPLVAVAGGVVLMRGGALSHLAVWCRERRVPAVAAVAAEAPLEAGMRIHLDADRGELRLG